MKNKLPKYDNYKPSNVEWLGEIPQHWEVLANKHIFNLKKNQVGKKSKEYDLLSLTLNGVIKRDMENPQGKFPAEFDTYQEVKKGDFIFCLFDVEETPRTVGLSDFDGMITGAYTVMHVNKSFNKEFLYYFYLNLDKDKRLKSLYTGLRNTISKENFFSFKTYVPPLSEQEKIAQFLDEKTTKIDKAIEIKQRQIELLKERRQILIHRAVTRGVGSLSGVETPLKDSGVEWIGEIPEHWEVKKVKHLVAKAFSGGTPSTDKLDFWDGGIPWVSSVDVKTDYLFKTTREISEKGLNRSSSSLAPKGSVIFVTRSGILQHTFAISILGKEMAINQDIKCLILYEILSAEYFQKIIKGNNSQILVEVRQQGATVESINMDSFFNLTIALPPVSEQYKIIEYIENISAKISKAIGLKEREIEVLKEYKSSLINSAITGKVRVF